MNISVGAEGGVVSTTPAGALLPPCFPTGRRYESTAALGTAAGAGASTICGLASAATIASVHALDALAPRSGTRTISRVLLAFGQRVRAKAAGDAACRTTKSSLPLRSHARAALSPLAMTAQESTTDRAALHRALSRARWADVEGAAAGSTRRRPRRCARRTRRRWAGADHALESTTIMLIPARCSLLSTATEPVPD